MLAAERFGLVQGSQGVGVATKSQVIRGQHIKAVGKLVSRESASFEKALGEMSPKGCQFFFAIADRILDITVQVGDEPPRRHCQEALALGILFLDKTKQMQGK
jgi:hypothetical protein